jgi:hypothetical protein
LRIGDAGWDLNPLVTMYSQAAFAGVLVNALLVSEGDYNWKNRKADKRC